MALKLVKVTVSALFDRYSICHFLSVVSSIQYPLSTSLSYTVSETIGGATRYICWVCWCWVYVC